MTATSATTTTTTPAPEIILDDDQKAAIDEIHSPNKNHVIVTGRAGSGKSEVIRQAAKRGKLALTATTGRAALLIGGTTVDRQFGFSRKDWKLWNEHYTEKIMRDAPKVIVIDEASMIGVNMANTIFDLAEKYDKKLVLVGDWGQASPVNEEWPFSTKLITNAEVIRLTHAHRQHDKDYLDALEEVRNGALSDTAIKLFATRIGEGEDDDARIRIFATNKAVDDYNWDKVMELIESQKPPTVEPTTSVIGMAKQLSEQEVARFKEDARFCDGDIIAPGCRVMLTWNGKGYVNGDLGTVECLVCMGKDGKQEIIRTREEAKTDEIPERRLQSVTVRLDRGNYLIGVVRQDAEFKGPAEKNGPAKVVAVATGFPLRLGYAVTIHKAQGCTVDHAFVDMDSIESFPEKARHGLAYVALSRTRTLAGLGLSSKVNRRMVLCEKIVKESGIL
jgi:ATP-dependent DNA helicase PIF1